MNFQVETFLKAMNNLNSTVNIRQLKKEHVNTELLENKNIEVIRTLPFEYIESLLPTFSQISGFKAHFSYSDYDTALSQIEILEKSDLRIVWMDWRLYKEKMSPKETVEWVITRIKSGRNDKPVLINNWPTFFNQEDQLFSLSSRDWFRQLNNLLIHASEDIPMLELIDLEYLASKKGLAAYDQRNDQISNYPFSNLFTIDIARHLALNLLPAIFHPRLKAIIIDLDNTMYSGVIGEDGYKGILLQEGHIELQRILLALKKSGIILAICSKNEYSDVEEMFSKRKDFLLKLEDFTFIEANWSDKASNISSIIKKINIDPSAVLFVDDNMAEIAQVMMKLPNLHVILADTEGKETVHRILNYPGLYQLKEDETASIRQDDILANQKRSELLEKAVDEISYLNSLKMKIEIHENNPSHIQRVYELSNKTNQFNLALKRYSLHDVGQFIHSDDIRIFTIELSDILSNSGIIGVFICEIREEHVNIKETLFSCRALGRLVESSALFHILQHLQQSGIKFLSFDSVKGPKNKPSLDWLISLEIGKQCKIDKLQHLLEQNLVNFKAEVIKHYE